MRKYTKSYKAIDATQNQSEVLAGMRPAKVAFVQVPFSGVVSGYSTLSIWGVNQGVKSYKRTIKIGQNGSGGALAENSDDVHVVKVEGPFEAIAFSHVNDGSLAGASAVYDVIINYDEAV